MEMEDANARTHKGRWQKNESSTSKWARQYLNQGRGRGRGRGKKEDGGDGDENQLYRGNKSKQTKRGETVGQNRDRWRQRSIKRICWSHHLCSHLLGLSKADLQPASLIISTVGTRYQFPEGTTAREPGL